MRERFFVRRASRLSCIICTRGEFAAPAASDFLDGQKVTKEPLGGGRNRRFGKASRGRVPVKNCNISGAQNLSGFLHVIPGHWALSLQKLPLVRFNFCA